MKSHKKNGGSSIEKKARRLMADPLFLFKASQKIGELGVVGEERNRLILLLAGIARTLEEPPSVLVKGSTSSGKSTLVKRSIQLFPPECVIERASLSRKALAYGGGSLASKILFINEYRCGKDSQQLLRLLQSEGRIKHESTTIRGAWRGTKTLERLGTPVVLTTTTDEKVFTDDETRFLSLWVDESEAQTLAILTAQASVSKPRNFQDLPVWRKAMSLLAPGKNAFCNPPAWLRYVAQRLPLQNVRVRRDWNRFLNFCKAVALCRRPLLGVSQVLDITFGDYCVAYRILEPVLASTAGGVPVQELTLSRAVALLNKRFRRAVTVREIARELDWKASLVYKHLKSAVTHRLLEYVPGIREKNLKLLIATADAATGFLPSPFLVFRSNPEVRSQATYVDPFTGKRRRIVSTTVTDRHAERSQGEQD